MQRHHGSHGGDDIEQTVVFTFLLFLVELILTVLAMLIFEISRVHQLVLPTPRGEWLWRLDLGLIVGWLCCAAFATITPLTEVALSSASCLFLSYVVGIEILAAQAGRPLLPTEVRLEDIIERPWPGAIGPGMDDYPHTTD